MDNNTLPERPLSLSQNERSQLAIIMSSGGFAGMVSCSTALALLVFFKMYKHLSERLSLYLLLSGLFVASVLGSMIVGVGLDLAHYHRLCQAIGFFLQYSIWTLLLLTTFVTFHLASLVFFHKLFEKLELFYILFTLIFPLMFSWIPFLTDSYGLAGGWCWIRANSTYSPYEEGGVIEQFTLWFGPLFLIQIGNSVVMVAISVVLCHRSFRKTDHLKAAINEQTMKNETNTFEEASNEALNHHYKEALKRNLPLLLYPIIYTIFHWLPTVNRLRIAISPSSFVLWVIHGVNSATFTFFMGITFIIYVIAKKKLTKQNIKKAARNWKHTFTRMRKSYEQFHDQHPTVIRPSTDAFTTEGYTVTSPTTWEPARESAFII